MRTIFLELQFFLNIAPVLAGRIIAPFTLSALKRYQFHHILLARHNIPSLLSRVSGVVNRMLPRSGSKTSLFPSMEFYFITPNKNHEVFTKEKPKLDISVF